MNDPISGLLTSPLTWEGTAMVSSDPMLGMEGDGEAFAALVEGLEAPVGEEADTPVLVASFVGVEVTVLAETPDLPDLPELPDIEQPVVNVVETENDSPVAPNEATAPVEVKAAPADEPISVATAEAVMPQPDVQTEALPIIWSEAPVALPTVAAPVAGVPAAANRGGSKTPDNVRESPRAALVERPSPKAGAALVGPQRPESPVPQDAVKTVARPEEAPIKTEDKVKVVAAAAIPFVMNAPGQVKADAPTPETPEGKQATVTVRPSPPAHGPVETKPTVPSRIAGVQRSDAAPFNSVASARSRSDAVAQLVLAGVSPGKALGVALSNPLAASPAPVLVQTVAAPVAAKVRAEAVQADAETDIIVTEPSVAEDLPEPLVQNVGSTDSAPRTSATHSAEPRGMPERVQAAQVIRQIDAAVTRSDNGTIEVSLNPKELGQVTIRIEGLQNDTRMMFTADRPETLQLLKSHQGELQSALQASGFSQLDLSFADRSPGQSRQPTPAPAQAFTEQTETLPEPPRWENMTRRATSGRYDRRI